MGITKWGNKEKIFSGIAVKPLNVLLRNFAIMVVKVSNTKPLDNAPGGRGSFILTFKHTLKNTPIIKKVSSADIFDRDYHNFVSTTSALDLRNTNNLFYNVHSGITGSDGIAYKGIDYNSSVSPFDAIFVSANNEDHVICGTTFDIAKFVTDEVMMDNLFLQNRLIASSTDFEATNTVTTGRNVTNKIPQGDFIVENEGHVNIRGGSKVVLKAGTHLKPKQDGSIRIYIDPFENCNFFEKKSLMSDDEDTPPIVEKYETIYNKSKIEKECFLKNYPNPFTNTTTIEYQIKNSQNVFETLSLIPKIY